jgi:hypothetical protein
MVHLPPKFHRAEALPRRHPSPSFLVVALGFGEGAHEGDLADESGLIEQAAGHFGAER